MRSAAAQGRPHARRQLAHAEGLGHVVVGAGIEPDDTVALAGARRQHDDGHGGRRGALAQDAAHFEAVQHRQIQVEHHQVGRQLGGGLQCGVAAGHGFDFDVAAALERVLDEVGDVLLVVDDEHAAAPGARHRRPDAVAVVRVRLPVRSRRARRPGARLGRRIDGLSDDVQRESAAGIDSR